MIQFLPQNEFFRKLEYERSLTDRNDRVFSIIIFDLTTTNDNFSVMSNFVYALKKRFRQTDEIGWLNEHHLCAILPETPAEKAKRPANDVCALIPPNQIAPSWSIFTYPSNWINVEKNDTMRPPQKNYDSLRKIQRLTCTHIPLWKKIMDMSAVIIGLILISPLILLIAIYIKCVSPGPIFFKQKRIGYKGKTFFCWKFRTMKSDSQQSVHQQYLSKLINSDMPMKKLDDEDPRIIPLGKFMRKTGLDELPQLFNVIKGEMSLIGPRPCIPYEAKQYLTWQHKRFDTLPGLTGLWQVNGKNRTTFNEMMRFDVSYIKKMSLWLDIKILLKTPSAIIKQLTGKKKKMKELSLLS